MGLKAYIWGAAYFILSRTLGATVRLYLVINVLMVYLADWIVSPGFRVEGFIAALLFSLALSVVNSLLDAMAGD